MKGTRRPLTPEEIAASKLRQHKTPEELEESKDHQRWMRRVVDYAHRLGFPLGNPRKYRKFKDGHQFAVGSADINPPKTVCMDDGKKIHNEIDSDRINKENEEIVEQDAQKSANLPVRFLIAVACISAIALLFHEGCRSHEINHSQNPEHSESSLGNGSTTQTVLYQALNQTYPLKDTSIPFSSDTDVSNDD